MGLITKFQKYFDSGKQSSTKPTEFGNVLRASIEVVSSFGSIMEKPNPVDGFGVLQSEKHLPFPRETIMKAISLLQAALAEPKARTMIIRELSPEEAEHLLSPKFSNALSQARVYLDMFVPESELEDQKQLAKDTASILDSLSAEERQKFESSLPAHALEAIQAARNRQK